MIILMFICALALSGVAAFYSIAGLMAIFAAAPIPIAIMGTILEGSKLVVASWLYRNWDPIPKLFRLYFTTALLVLMALTSMGIFGFLSKSHLDQAVPVGDLAAQVELIDQKITTEKERVDEAKRTLAQLDAQVNETLARTQAQTTDSAVRRSVSIRKQQAKERGQLLQEIKSAQESIKKLTEERAPLKSQVRKVEAEVGPIKYIAALIYGDQLNEDLLEKAVRGVIILLVIVFDPLAVMLLIAANWSLMNRRKDDKIQTSTTKEPIEYEEIEENIRRELEEDGDVAETSSPEFREKSEELDPDLDRHAYLKAPWNWMKNDYPSHSEWQTPPPPSTEQYSEENWVSRPHKR